jgi:two-component system sensor histidine kinase AtoS
MDVRAVLATTVTLLHADDAHGRVVVDTAGEAAPIMADAELLKIVFLNLLINSAQAMKGQGEVSIRVSEDAADCVVVLTDTGPGIPLEIRSRLFTPFVTTKARGTGLGLSTVKRLIEAHHGQIRVESPDSGGARITVRLPLA